MRHPVDMRGGLAAGLVIGAGLLTGCGGGAGGPAPQPTMTLDPHPPRAVAPGTTIRIVERGPSRSAGDGMPPLRTASAAREECAAAPAVYVAWTYGVASRDLDTIARVVAQHRAAPGRLPEVRAGCRAGLRREGDRP
jgi:hypothetical protein